MREEKKNSYRSLSKRNVISLRIDWVTEGTDCTALFASKLVNKNEPHLIANSDQVIDGHVDNFINDSRNRDLDGSIICFDDSEMKPKWAFAKLGIKKISHRS